MTTSITSPSKLLLRRAAVLCLWLLLWQGAWLLVGEGLLLPSPLSVFARMGAMALTGEFWLICLGTLGRILAGFGLGLFLGTLLGALSLVWPFLGEFLAPAMSLVKSTPVASFVILALVWLRGSGLGVFIALLMVLPLAWQNTRQGLGSADPQLLEMARVYRLSPWARCRSVYLPALLPYFLSAARVGLGFAWKAGIAGEVIAIPAGSMGLQLYNAKIYLETPALFAWTGYIVLFSVLLERLMVSLMGRLSHRLSLGTGPKEGS